MAQSKKTASLHVTFDTAQVDTDILTPSGNDYLFIWNVIVESEGEYDLKFPTSGSVIKGVGGIMGATGINKQGLDDEPLQLTCAANTTVRILFDEV
jgi:hypothetical protein